MSEPAIVLANERFQTPDGKTAHGLVRGTSRYQIRAVVDPLCAGQDAGQLLDGVFRNIPIVATIAEAATIGEPAATTCIVGIATLGGRFDDAFREQLLTAARAGLNIVSGLHEFVSDDPDIVAEATSRGLRIRDLRKPPAKADLHFWSGAIRTVKTPRIAVLGTDGGLGKRTTARLLVEAANDAGIRAEMIYTGQTGWMQGARYGFVLDSIANDFVCGELEHAIIQCQREAAPDLMVIEGQSALRNPSGPCGAELLLAGGARGVVLQHIPGQTYYEGFEELGFKIPTLESEIELIRYYGAETLAVSLNNRELGPAEFEKTRRQFAAALPIPVISPLIDGVGELLPAVRDFMAREAP
jgi:uncharacterized NAD-dependent epimerase/dehydratase family protein